MLPHLRGRPVTMERFPAGHRHARASCRRTCRRAFPTWLERVEVPKKDGTVHYPLVNDDPRRCSGSRTRTASRRTSGRRACPHSTSPTSASSISIRRTTSRTSLRAAALALRDLLVELGLPSWVKTSGSKGFHIVVPLDGRDDVRRGRAASRTRSAALLVERDPEHLTQEFIKADRGGRICVDTGRNGYGATFAAPYAVRPSRARPSRRRARGTRSSRARSSRSRSRCGRWPRASRPSATCGQTCRTQAVAVAGGGQGEARYGVRVRGPRRASPRR